MVIRVRPAQKHTLLLRCTAEKHSMRVLPWLQHLFAIFLLSWLPLPLIKQHFIWEPVFSLYINLEIAFHLCSQDKSSIGA